MSTMENQIMQIFSRKRTIEDQFKHLVDSFGEDLASNLLSEGLLPPPWLSNPRSNGPDPRELDREQLISEILDQHPRATTPGKSNISIVRDSKKTDDNLFSNVLFSDKEGLNKFCGAKDGDEFVSNDVPESSMRNSKTRVEAEVMENQFTYTPVSHNDTNSHPSTKAKTLHNLVEGNDFLELMGRVARSMSAGQKSGYVNNSVSRPGSPVCKSQTLDPPSIMTKSHKIANLAHVDSVVNDCISDDLIVYTTDDARQLAKTLSSRLCAISLLYESDIHLAETIECDDSPVSKFYEENNEEILHDSRTVSRIEEPHMDSAKGQIDGFIKIPNPSSSIQVPCKSFGKTPASNRDVEECHANSNEAASWMEQLRKSGSMLSIDSCPLDDDIRNIPDVSQSLPARILRHLNLTSSHSNASDKDQPLSSNNVRRTEKYPLTPPRKTVKWKSFASREELVPIPELSNNVRTTEKYPLTPPRKTVKKKSCASGEELVPIPELLCFHIDESPNVSQESTSNNVVKSNVLAYTTSKHHNAMKSTDSLSRKRDVKALEATDAAKRLAEKKQLEGEMNKAATKLERARLEQGNIRQLELKQEQKEEPRKKREAEIKAKERQREVEKAQNERKGKKRETEFKAKKRQREVEKDQNERKKRCTEEVLRQQRAHKKNIEDKDEDSKKRKGKELSEVKKPTKTENGDKGSDDEDLSSYEISSYKDTDDEDGTEEYMREWKFVPSWAWKESLNRIILGNCHLNPSAIFSHKRSTYLF